MSFCLPAPFYLHCPNDGGWCCEMHVLTFIRFLGSETGRLRSLDEVVISSDLWWKSMNGDCACDTHGTASLQDQRPSHRP